MNKHTRTKNSNSANSVNSANSAKDRTSTDPLQELHDSEAKSSEPNREYVRIANASRSISPQIASDLSYRLMAVVISRSNSEMLSRPKPTTEMDTELEQILLKLESESRIRLEPGPVGLRLKRLLQQFSQGRIHVLDVESNRLNNELASRCSDAIHSAISALSHSEQFQKAVQRESKQAIYSFAYGLSHEINNPLANIAARAQQLIATAGSEADRRSLATIVDQTMRAHEMLSEMMRVVQPRPLRLRTENVIAVVQDTMQRHAESWKHSKIRVDLKVGPKPIYAAMERSSLAEALQAILQNAIQVCGPNDRINVFCGEESKANEGESGRVRISVSDTGPGLSHESAERVWDLYFSGREHGRGLGISLANVRRIVDAHHGEVWIESAPGAGCVIEIRLPKSPEPATARRQPTR